MTISSSTLVFSSSMSTMILIPSKCLGFFIFHIIFFISTSLTCIFFISSMPLLTCLIFLLLSWTYNNCFNVFVYWCSYSNICVISGSASIDWLFFLIMGHIFLIICLLGILDWMADIVNFILSGAGYFCIPINIFVLCSGMQLSNLQTVWSFRALLLWFVQKV